MWGGESEYSLYSGGNVWIVGRGVEYCITRWAGDIHMGVTVMRRLETDHGTGVLDTSATAKGVFEDDYRYRVKVEWLQFHSRYFQIIHEKQRNVVNRAKEIWRLRLER